MLNALATYGNIIEEGATYRRMVGSTMTETAEVLEVARDKMGIPHVRFELRVAYGASTALVASTERRTLSLDTFQAKYRERV